MARHVSVRARLASFTRFDKLLALRERIAALFRGNAKPYRPTRLSFETMEDRIVPDGRPLPFPVIFAGSGIGESPVVKAYDAETGELDWTKTVYSSPVDSVRVGTADFTGDNYPDVVVAPGAGHTPRIKIFDGKTGDLISGPVANFLAYSSDFDGGVHVAAADIDGDGIPDVVTGAVVSAGARVKAFSGVDGSVLANFIVPGSAFANGIKVAAADITGDGKAEVVVGAGSSGGGRVRIYDPLTATVISGPLGNFRAFGNDYDGGVFVGSDSLAGDVDGDGVLDLAVGTGNGFTARVKVFSGTTGDVLYDFEPFGSSVTGGARVALAYVNDDEFADMVVGSGPGSTATIRVFSGATGDQLASPLGEYTPFGSSEGGVFVAASNDPKSVPTFAVTYNGHASPSLETAESLTVRVVVTGPTVTPTGNVTLDVLDAFDTPIYSQVLSLAVTTAPQAAVTFTAFSLAAGDYTIAIAYVGDSNHFGANAAEFISLATSNKPAGQPVVTECPPDLVATPKGGVGATGPGISPAKVNYRTGTVQLTRSDLASSGYGVPWGHEWSWTNAPGYGDGMAGSGATQSQAPHLVQVNGNDSLAMVSDAQSARFFDTNGSTYQARYGETAALSHPSGEFVVTDGTGQKFTFYDFSGGTPSGRAGKLKSVTDAEGNLTEVTSWDGSGRPTEVQRVSGSGGSALTESFVYTYVASGTNAGLLDTVTQRTRVGTGSWTTIRSTAYTYHDGTTSVGKAGDLRTAVVKDGTGTTIDTAYYRYYTSGSQSLLKYAFGADAYNRLTAARGTSVDSLSDVDVDEFADKYLEYDGSNRVTKVVDAAAGCSVCSGGQGEFTYSYSTNSSFTGVIDPNSWSNKTIETLPDGTTNTVYTNASGQVMLFIYTDASSNQWRSYNKYDSAGRIVLQAGPSAVTGFSESYSDLVHYSSGNAQYLSDSAGLVAAYTYGSSTTATSSVAGDALGFLKQVDIKRGETGTAVPQAATTYIKRTVGSQDFFFVASSTAYRNDNGTGGQTTSYTYTWHGSTAQLESMTTTLTSVTTAQNGPNSSTSITTFFDEFGHPVWFKDAGGVISYIQYDTLTGAMVKSITDVDTDNSGDFANLPSGWSSPSGLHFIGTYQVDSLGRVTKSTSPEGRVDYTIYNDSSHEVRYYPGWNTMTNAPTGPTTVSRYDSSGEYTETLKMSAAPTLNGSNLPTGAESISKVQSLSRSYTNAVGQMTYSDVYFDLSGLTYSTSATFGTEGTNFYRTEYAYDKTGQVNRAESSLGTIFRTIHDGQGRVVSEWVGTDDTPTSGTWSPTNTTGTNLVKVRDYEYDGGGVGEGNVTKVTEYPGGGATARVTQTWFDWRNRAVATKQGVEGSESTGVNRPLSYFDYDNLGQVTKVRLYDADNVTPTTTSGVPQPLSSSLLRAQSSSSYDELGRVYLSETYSVNPSSGSVAGNTLKTYRWYDARGQVIKTSAPGGIVQKMTYDGAGRVVTSYLTDGGGDSGYSDADDVSGDTVLEQYESTFDDDGLVLSSLVRARFHDASGTGALGTPSSGIGARVSYTGHYYDASSGRLTSTVDVGTNGGSSWTRTGSVPSRSDTELVTSYNYAADAVQMVKLTGSPTGGTFTLTFGVNTTSAIAYNASAATVDAALEALGSIGSGNVVVTASAGGGWQIRFSGTLAGKYQSKITASGAGLTGGSSPSVAVSTISAGGDTGRVFEMTDPKALVSRSYVDALGRTIQSIENFVDGAVSDADDKTTVYTYNAAGMTSLTALLTGGGGQTTQWVYGITQGGGNKLDSNDAVGVTQWPDPTTGAASGSEQETATVNALGQTLTYTDRNGSVHTLTYDILGRVTIDAVTTLGSGVNGSVRRIETAYDGQGNAYLITSYDAASSGSIVNQVQREFNGLGQMVTEWQAHGGAVNTSTSPKVQYAYSEMASSANHSRLTSMTYPSGYVLTFNYSSGLNSNVSRLSSISDSSGSLESYDYLGTSIVVIRSHSQPGVDLTYVGTPADGGDQYAGLDRFGRVADQKWVKSGTPLDRFQYGYDRNSNRTYRDNLVNTAFGEVYTYDNLGQLSSFDRGTLNGGKTGISGVVARSQDWDYDALGNWDSLTTNGGSPQTRTHNAQNEITGISGATTPTFDANGNMTTDETGRQFVYDAWNRLVVVKNAGGTTLKSYSYEGMNRRVTETASGTTTSFFYSSAWQVLEEKVGSNTTKRYVWSPVYADAMVLRDRDTDGNGTLDERLWVQQDANFNVTALVSGSGIVVERYSYDPFGAVTVYDASFGALGGGSNYGWQYMHQGGRFDLTSALYNFRNRDYSPQLGRWVTNDPLEFQSGEANFVRAGMNNLVNFLDPMGLSVLNFKEVYYETGFTRTLPRKATTNPGAFSWAINWYVAGAKQKQGIILQHIKTRVEKMTDPTKKLITDPKLIVTDPINNKIRYDLYNSDYWEIWWTSNNIMTGDSISVDPMHRFERAPNGVFKKNAMFPAFGIPEDSKIKELWNKPFNDSLSFPGVTRSASGSFILTADAVYIEGAHRSDFIGDRGLKKTGCDFKINHLNTGASDELASRPNSLWLTFRLLAITSQYENDLSNWVNRSVTTTWDTEKVWPWEVKRVPDRDPWERQ